MWAFVGNFDEAVGAGIIELLIAGSVDRDDIEVVSYPDNRVVIWVKADCCRGGMIRRCSTRGDNIIRGYMMKKVNGLRIGCVVVIEKIGNAWHICEANRDVCRKYDEDYIFCPICKAALVKKVDMSIQIIIEGTDDLEDFLCGLRRKVDRLIEEEIKIYQP